MAINEGAKEPVERDDAPRRLVIQPRPEENSSEGPEEISSLTIALTEFDVDLIRRRLRARRIPCFEKKLTGRSSDPSILAEMIVNHPVPGFAPLN